MRYLLTFSDRYVSFEDRFKFIEMAEWLDINIGVGHWKWCTGDMYAAGVYLPTKQDITAFKLRFKL